VIFWSFGLALFALSAPARADLTPDQIVLIANRRVPASIKLAEQYAAARHIPTGHTLLLDVPESEDIDFWHYETDVVPAVRQFLREGNLAQTTTCLVTFYGVPFRISARAMTNQDRVELDALKARLAEATAKVTPVVTDLEKIEHSLDANWQASAGDEITQLAFRTRAAMLALERSLRAIADPATRQPIISQIAADITALGGPVELADAFVAGESESALSPQQKANWQTTVATVRQYRIDILRLEDRRYDRAVRAQILTIAQEHFGMLGYANLINAEIGYLDPDMSAAALDSELSLLWWTIYARPRWQDNVLNYRYRAVHPPALMVMRLDGPDVKTVSAMIDTSVRVEQQGLTGTVAIDSRGIPPINAAGKLDDFGIYDQSMRDFAKIVKRIGNPPLVTDDSPSVFKPNSVPNVAVYCGWYSLRNYVPGCSFVPGAVGFHIASLEMISLHEPNETGWVRGLLKDGCVATLGAVAEPYLQSFPNATDFFGLLLTGKLTLAEVYWKTTPMASWMIDMIGDPLYRPFAAHPALTEADIPAELQSALHPRAAAPFSLPPYGPAPSAATQAGSNSSGPAQ
jgi:uncharacterized protein (TIGR03790 family)